MSCEFKVFLTKLKSGRREGDNETLCNGTPLMVGKISASSRAINLGPLDQHADT